MGHRELENLQLLRDVASFGQRFGERGKGVRVVLVLAGLVLKEGRRIGTVQL